MGSQVTTGSQETTGISQQSAGSQSTGSQQADAVGAHSGSQTVEHSERFFNQPRNPRPAHAGLKVMMADRSATVEQRTQYLKRLGIVCVPVNSVGLGEEASKYVPVMLVRQIGLSKQTKRIKLCTNLDKMARVGNFGRKCPF